MARFGHELLSSHHWLRRPTAPSCGPLCFCATQFKDTTWAVYEMKCRHLYMILLWYVDDLHCTLVSPVNCSAASMPDVCSSFTDFFLDEIVKKIGHTWYRIIVLFPNVIIIMKSGHLCGQHLALLLLAFGLCDHQSPKFFFPTNPCYFSCLDCLLWFKLQTPCWLHMLNMNVIGQAVTNPNMDIYAYSILQTNVESIGSPCVPLGPRKKGYLIETTCLLV